MKDNYTLYHVHTHLSNATTTLDSVDSYDNYIALAVKNNMKALAISEHGSVLSWVAKKQAIEKAGLKYIHAMESYVTEKLPKEDEQKVRDNYHFVLIAKNWDGVKEINKLSSKSFDREDGHFYFSPRITLDELINTSDNIIITTACLGGVLYSGTDTAKEKFLNFAKENTYRVFLEIQHHKVKEQIEHNKYLYDLSRQYGFKLIAGTDTHYSDDLHREGRDLLQKRKNIHFDNEDGWDLCFKSYDELVESYKEQNSLPLDVVLEAIENTNLVADMVEEFELDRSHKYPKLYDDPIGKIKERIKEEFKKKFGHFEKDKQVEYLERVKYELNAMAKGGSIEYILLEDFYKNKMRENNAFAGPGRGSVAGSLLAYLLNITEIDSILYDLSFERFHNPDRVSLPDVDSDWKEKDRDKVKSFLHNEIKEYVDNLYTAEIVTFNTIALKGAIRDVCGALDINQTLTNKIAKNAPDNESYYRKKYPKIFKYVDLLNGVVVSFGSHPAGTIVSPVSLDDNMGLFAIDGSQYPVSQINMKEVDNLNYVKLDVLGLNNIDIVHETCEMAGIDRLSADTIDLNDEDVWQDIMKSPVGIFQFEKQSTHNYMKKLFDHREDIASGMWKYDDKVKNLMIMSLANSAIRPVGDSFRDQLGNGLMRDNGHKALNELLSETHGYLVYQEQILTFLNKFCGFTKGEADIVRRGFAKKIGTEQYIPRIKEGFIKTITEQYGDTKEHAEEIIENFLEIIIDASRYLFNLSHSVAYSTIGYMCGYLRYYHTAEFMTSVLNINEDNPDKTKSAMGYLAQFTDIKVLPPTFGKSKSKYTYHKNINTIYKGIKSIKYMNEAVANQLYDLSSNNYSNFVELLSDIKTKTSIDARQLSILIQLNFFRDFGKANYLLKVVDIFDDFFESKVLTKSKLEESYPPIVYSIIESKSRATDKQFRDFDWMDIIVSVVETLDESDDLPFEEQLKSQKKYMGYIDNNMFSYQSKDSGKYCTVQRVFKDNTPYLIIKTLKGKTRGVKIDKRKFNYSIDEGTVLKIVGLAKKPGYDYLGEDENGRPKYKINHDKQEVWITEYKVIDMD